MITNSKGEVVLRSRSVFSSPGLEWFFQFIYRRSKTAHECLICPFGAHVQGTQDDKTTNIINTHIKKVHQNMIEPWEHISEDERKRVIANWNTIKDRADLIIPPAAAPISGGQKE